MVWRVLLALHRSGGATIYRLTVAVRTDRRNVKKALYPLVAIGLVQEEKQPVYSKKQVREGSRVVRFRTLFRLNEHHSMAPSLHKFFEQTSRFYSLIPECFSCRAKLSLLLLLACNRHAHLTVQGITARLGFKRKSVKKYLQKLVPLGVVRHKTLGDISVWTMNWENDLAHRFLEFFTETGQLTPPEIPMHWRAP